MQNLKSKKLLQDALQELKRLTALETILKRSTTPARNPKQRLYRENIHDAGKRLQFAKTLLPSSFYREKFSIAQKKAAREEEEAQKT